MQIGSGHTGVRSTFSKKQTKNINLGYKPLPPDALKVGLQCGSNLCKRRMLLNLTFLEVTFSSDIIMQKGRHFRGVCQRLGGGRWEEETSVLLNKMNLWGVLYYHRWHKQKKTQGRVLRRVGGLKSRHTRRLTGISFSSNFFQPFLRAKFVVLTTWNYVTSLGTDCVWCILLCCSIEFEVIHRSPSLGAGTEKWRQT